MTPRLDEGVWFPALQMYSCGGISVGSAAQTFPGSVGVSKDPLKNESQAPLIVRAFSCTVNWVDSRASTASPLLFDMTVHSRRKGQYKLQQQSVMYSAPTNFVTGLYGSTSTAAMPYVWKLASPARWNPGEVILFEYGNVANETSFTWSSAQAKATKYSIRCRGVNSKQIYVYGGGGTPSAGARLSGVHQNLTGEPLEVLSVTMLCGTVTTDRPIFNMEIGGKRVTRAERPFWLFAEPFKHSRLLFDRLPEGGLLFEFGDHLEITVQNNQYTNLTLTLGLEGYQKVS